jgi:LysM repeat protein
MRALIPVLALAALVATGCERRDSLNNLPDSNGHAGGPGASNSGSTWQKVPRNGEQVYTVAQGDTLTSVAQKFGTTVEWLIERNDFRAHGEFKPGKTIIVPRK